MTKIILDSESKWIKQEEFELFRYLTINGKYYQYVMDYLKTSDKGSVKEMTYKVLFGKNASNSKADKVFSQLFPTIHHFIKLYKKEKGDYKILSYELQRAESNLIFNKIIKDIINNYPEIKIVTVHDSIIISKKWKDSVESIFKTKLFEEFNIL